MQVKKLNINFKYTAIPCFTDKRFTIEDRSHAGILTEVLVIVDNETCVNYLYVDRGITPLLDAEGKPIITK